MPLLIDKLAPLGPNHHLGLMLDYDGTLSPLVSDPSQAWLMPQQLDILSRVCQHPFVNVAIVSGRSVQQLHRFLSALGSSRLVLCGLHGGEIYDQITQRWLKHDQADGPATQALHQFKHALMITLGLSADGDLLQHGLRLEDKGESLALHVRQANTAQANNALAQYQALFAATPAMTQYFKLQPGKAVLEAVPLGYDKGKAVRFLLTHWHTQHPMTPCYVGDDLTDEAAFQVMNTVQGGLSIVIGKALTETAAQYRLDAITDLYAELAALAARSHGKSLQVDA
jgi:trehalose 6-phosphate phosphatase